MNCQQLQANIFDLLRGETERSAHAAALEHAEHCDACRTLLEAERRVTAALQGLAASQAHLSAGGELEAKLLAEFRMMRQRKVAARTARWKFAAVAACLIVLATVVYGALHYRPRAEDRHPYSVAPQLPGPASRLDERPRAMPQVPASAPTPKSRTLARSTTRPRSRRREAAPTQVVTAFYAVPYAEPLRPEEAKRVVRLRLPQSTLVPLGLPVIQDRAGDFVDAEVLVGEDNLARAIRLVGESRPANQRSQRRAGPMNTSFVR